MNSNFIILLTIFIILLIVLFLYKILTFFFQHLHQNQKQILENLEQKILSQTDKLISSQNQNVIEKLYERNGEVLENLHELQINISEHMEKKFENTFQHSLQTFEKITSQLKSFQHTQNHMENLAQNILSLQNILNSHQQRGLFGEIQLKQILFHVFGQTQGKLFDLQKKLSTGVIVDSIIYAPYPPGPIPIDSKFPLKNFILKDSENSSHKLDSKFKENIKKHILDIAQKYIIPPETAHQAILFLPSETIFSDIHAYYPDIVAYAIEKRVWICSPTTLIATLFTLQSTIHEIHHTEQQKDWIHHIERLYQDAQSLHQKNIQIQNKMHSIQKELDDICYKSENFISSLKKIKTIHQESFFDSSHDSKHSP